jgi:replication factor A2
MDYQGDMGGGGGGFGGGGGSFGGKSFGGGGNSQGQQHQPRARKSYDDQTLIPVTARMVLAAHSNSNTEGSLQLQDGRDLHMVKLVGAIRAYEDFSTNVLYQVEDGTGLVDVKQWLDENECSVATEIRQATLKDHIYVKVIGQVKEYDGNKQIIASSVRALTTSNELTHHMLEVVYSGEKAKIRDAIVPPNMNMNMMMGSGGGAMGGYGQPLAPSGFGASSNELKEAVVKFIRAEEGMTGMLCSCFGRLSPVILHE